MIMKLFCKTLAAIATVLCLWISSIEALSDHRSQQCLAVVVALIGGLGAGGTLVTYGIKNNDVPKLYAGSCMVAFTILGALYVICIPPYNWYRAE